MQKYKDYQPTGFDRPGLGIHHNMEDQAEWLVPGISQNRDSGCLARSNFECFQKYLEDIEDEGNTWQIHRFGHWACGWFEIFTIKPGSEAETLARETENALSNYPVIDDMHFSELEEEEANETWSGMDIDERVQMIQQLEPRYDGKPVSIFSARHDYFPSDDQGAIRQHLVDY
tara:strand:+ start:1525 stop:2043 length:519 start_codon:yes stop_codon:yes gene_type:complete